MASKNDQPTLPRAVSDQRSFQEVIADHLPRPATGRNTIVAFFIGGLICLVGQAIQNGYMALGFSKEDAANPTVATLILIASVVTALGGYDRFGQFAGAGAAVPVTGFANSIVSSAMERRTEGWILGVGAEMFRVAGPVIVFGVVAAFFVALIYAAIAAI
ncbi:MAG: stage V sporulation protein AC [Firmicutes bacterium]|nr:stage V sporulation protein AC [Bacillota bacterium]